jgi:hypothetical protein
MRSQFGAAMILGQIAAMGGFDPFMGAGSKRLDPLDEIDIETEYELIQRKESSLSASQRREVEWRYKRMHNAKNEGLTAPEGDI